MNTYNDLPIYDATFDDDGLLIEAISFVKRPANQHEFVAMHGEPARFSVIDDEQRIVTGLVMAVDMLIYRRDDKRGEYYVRFSAETVDKMLTDFMRALNGATVNLDHNKTEFVDGVFMKESYKKDTAAGIAPVGYDDIADGSWFATFKVENDDVWAAIKNGTFKGFSIHGRYGLIVTDDDAEFAAIFALLDEIATDINTIL